MAEWIDIHDRLPTRLEDVLVYTDYGCTVAHFDLRARNWRGENDRPLRVRVTHWTPLPSAPSDRKPRPQTARTCGHCKNWERGICTLPRSPRFTDDTLATDGCTPNRKGRPDWI